MAIDTVTTGTGDATMEGSLAYELAHAQAGDTINFAPDVTQVTLSSTLTITQNVTIEGLQPGGSTASAVTISGNETFTDIVINSGVTATLDGLTITRGSGLGAAGASSSTRGGNGGAAAGAIFDSGTLSITNSSITGNAATGGRGADGAGVNYVAGFGGGGGGSAAGGIYVASGASLHTASSDTFSGNTAQGGNGGNGGAIGYYVGGQGGNGATALSPSSSAGAAGQMNGNGGGGLGGGAGQPGGTGYYSGGGGGGGNAFSDYGGAGSIANDAVAPTVAACYCTGTLIRGASENKAVEGLAIGDVVVTSTGAHRPIRWLGHRTIDCRNHPRPHEVLPIRILAHAFGENRPARDLFVSPGHSICVDVVGEVLIPASALINGSTIRQVEVAEVTYWHVELDSHDILIAENLPAESYLDMGNRGFFQEADVVDLAAGPDADPAQRTHADFCRPFHAGGRLVETVRDQLRGRAETMGWALDDRLDMYLEVDGQRVDPAIRGLSARFQVPAEAKDVWLVSPAARPLDTKGTQDGRNLGLLVRSLRIEDGWSEPRNVAINDPLLCVGFHDVEQDAWRWTTGRARLPAALWDGCEEGFYLRVDLAGPPVPRWKSSVANEIRLAIVA